MDTTVLKCPGCGSPLPYDASIRKWKCSACGSEYDAVQVMQMTKDSDQDTDTQKQSKQTTPPPYITNDTDRDHFMSAEEAMSWGIVDKVL